MKSILPRKHVNSGCPICGSHEVMHDEVLELGTLQLSECRHCDHRWTGACESESFLGLTTRSMMQVRPPCFEILLDEDGEVASAA